MNYFYFYLIMIILLICLYLTYFSCQSQSLKSFFSNIYYRNFLFNFLLHTENVYKNKNTHRKKNYT